MKIFTFTLDELKKHSRKFKKDTELFSMTKFAKEHKHKFSYNEMEEIWWEEFESKLLKN